MNTNGGISGIMLNPAVSIENTNERLSSKKSKTSQVNAK